jgi:hypothetical protein
VHSAIHFTSLANTITILPDYHDSHFRDPSLPKKSPSLWTSFRSPPKPSRACRTSAPKISRSSTSLSSARPKRPRSSLVRAPQFCKQRPTHFASEAFILLGAWEACSCTHSYLHHHHSHPRAQLRLLQEVHHRPHGCRLARAQRGHLHEELRRPLYGCQHDCHQASGEDEDVKGTIFFHDHVRYG